LLTANPSGALELANRHPSLYPSGSFAQERDLIRIDALRATGRHTQALGLVERFLSRYPNSGHSVRLRAYQGSQNALIRDSD
jgi:outer membrane protein assembly factor BamD (BamD/ComL family)